MSYKTRIETEPTTMLHRTRKTPHRVTETDQRRRPIGAKNSRLLGRGSAGRNPASPNALCLTVCEHDPFGIVRYSVSTVFKLVEGTRVGTRSSVEASVGPAGSSNHSQSRPKGPVRRQCPVVHASCVRALGEPVRVTWKRAASGD